MNITEQFSLQQVYHCILSTAFKLPVGHFEVEWETGSRALLNCIVELFAGMHFHQCRARPQDVRK